MALQLIDWTIIITFLGISLAIGLKFKNQASNSLSNFFLGGRNLPWYIAGISMVATTFAADTPLAVTELVAQNGISGNWIWWNMLIGGMLTTFFFAKYWRRAEIVTELEFIELRYNGNPAAFLRGFKALYLGIFMNIMILGWVNLAMLSILEVFFDLQRFELFLCLGGLMLIATIYSSLSGMLGIAITDTVQFFIAMIGCIILAVIVLNSEQIGGITNLKAALPEGSLNFFPSFSNGDTTNTFALSIGAFLAMSTVQWWASWYPGAEPGGGGYVAQRMMSAKNEKQSLFATLFFQVAHYCIRPWPWIIVALCATVLYPDLADTKQGYVMAMRDFLPAGLKGLLFVAFIAAYMSTVSTQLNWGASFVVNDFYKRFIKTNVINETHYVNVSKLTTLLLMLLSLAVTTQLESISAVWQFIMECGAGLGLVLILRWYWWRINAWSEITATIAPFLAFTISKYILVWEFPNSFFFTVGFTTISWLVITFITAPEPQDKLKLFVEKIQPNGLWDTIYKLNNHKVNNSNFVYLLICWISSITMVYSILFASGKFIFLEWTEALLWSFSACISLTILLRFINKSKLLEN